MPMEPASLVAIGVLSIALFFAFALISFPVIWYYLWHRRRMQEVRGSHLQQVTNLHERIDKLEKKCHALQEQVTDAHMLLSDERRELDKKLAKSFPDVMPPIPEEPYNVSPQRRKGRKERTE